MASPDWLLRVTGYPLIRAAATALRFPVPPRLLRGPRIPAHVDTRAIAERWELQENQFKQSSPVEGTSGRLILDVRNSTNRLDFAASLFDGLRTRLTDFPRGGRCVVISGGPTWVSSGWGGFVRSLAKEIGGRGCGVNHLIVADSKTDQQTDALSGPLQFFLSPASAFITGQSLVVRPPLATLPSHSHRRRIAVVTGASRGIGAAIIRRLAGDGFHVIGVDLPVDPLRGDLAALMEEVGGSAVYASVGETGRVLEGVREAARQVGDRSGHGSVDSTSAFIDVLVHNAGITRDRTFRRMSPAEWGEVVEVNLEAVQRLNAAMGIGQAAGRGPRDRNTIPRDTPTPTPPRTPTPTPTSNAGCFLAPGGRVIFVSSINGIAGAFGQTNYAFTKAALIGLAEDLAEVGAVTGPGTALPGVTVNCVAPGFIESAMTARMPWLQRELGRRLNVYQQGGLPSDVAEAVGFLASEGASGITGQTLRICGGHMVGR